MFCDITKNSGAALREFKRLYPWFDFKFWNQLGYCNSEGSPVPDYIVRDGSYDALIAK